jgi:hypothetical protein
MRNRLSEIEVEAIRESLMSLFAARGALLDKSPRLDKIADEVFGETIVQALEAEFCRLDWRAYNAWAHDWSLELGEAWLPCDEWWNRRRGEPWRGGE